MLQPPTRGGTGHALEEAMKTKSSFPRTSVRGRLAVLLCIACCTAGCAAKPAGGGAAIPYHLVDLTTTTDPKTGKLVRVAVWNFDDGYTETTTDEVPAGNDGQRRTEHLPQPSPRSEP